MIDKLIKVLRARVRFLNSVSDEKLKELIGTLEEQSITTELMDKVEDKVLASVFCAPTAETVNIEPLLVANKGLSERITNLQRELQVARKDISTLAKTLNAQAGEIAELKVFSESIKRL
jgi:translation initiation factor IF-2